MYKFQGNVRLRICQRSVLNKSISIWNLLFNGLNEINILLGLKKSMKEPLNDIYDFTLYEKHFEPLLLKITTVLFAQWPNTIGQWFKLIKIEMSLTDAIT